MQPRPGHPIVIRSLLLGVGGGAEVRRSGDRIGIGALGPHIVLHAVLLHFVCGRCAIGPRVIAHRACRRGLARLADRAGSEALRQETLAGAVQRTAWRDSDSQNVLGFGRARSRQR
jgi:hypothetical protein